MLVLVRGDGHVHALRSPEERRAETEEERRDEQRPSMILDVRRDEADVRQTGHNQRHSHADQLSQVRRQSEIRQAEHQIDDDHRERTVFRMLRRSLKRL